MLPHRPRRASALVLLLALALLAGCGGDDDGAQTKASFINDADRVCESFADQFAKAGSREPRTPREVAEANDVIADIYERFSDRLSDVRLPEEEGRARTQAKAYVDSVRRADPLIDRLRAASARFVRAADGRDVRAIAAAGNDVRAALDAFRNARATSDRLAVQYGFNFCGNLS